jgi:hypothetical protein
VEAASTVVRIAATREATSREVAEVPAAAEEVEARADPTVRAEAEARADSTSRAAAEEVEARADPTSHAGAPAGELVPNSAAGTTAGSQEEEGARLADGNYAVRR